jgi:hypothetical protein
VTQYTRPDVCVTANIRIWDNRFALLIDLRAEKYLHRAAKGASRAVEGGARKSRIDAARFGTGVGEAAIVCQQG